MNYPVNCNKCNQPLYGPVKYCPFCGVASVSDQVNLTVSLTINTNPGGASVFLNGERKGTGPLAINDLKEGSYTVKVELNGYKTKEKNVTLGQEGQTLDITLEKPETKPLPVFANLDINTNPVGALVFLNGERKGSSPLTIKDLNQGSYTVRVEMEGYKPKEEHISLGQESKTLDIALEKLEPKPLPVVASLTINTNPSGATVFLNGERKGNSSLKINDLEKGNHSVRVELAGYEPKEEQITLGQENKFLDIKLKKNSKTKYLLAVVAVAVVAILAWAFLKKPPEKPDALVRLTINTQPSGAKVFLDGKAEGKSNLTISNLKKGTYTLKLELKGYKTTEEQITLSDETQTVDRSLSNPEPRPTPAPTSLASLTINTQPSGARVFLNGELKGTSNLTLNELQEGSYNLRVELGGYESQEKHISIQRENMLVDISLRKPPPPPDGSVDRGKIDTLLAEGEALFKQGKYPECIEKMNAVLRIDNRNAKARFYIGQAKSKLDRSRELSEPSSGGGRRY